MKALLYERELLKAFLSELRRAKHVQIAVALIRRKGIEVLGGHIDAFLRRGGRLDVVLGTDLPTDPEAIERLLAVQAQFSSSVRIRRFQSGPKGVFHPKLVVFQHANGRLVAIVGSSNLTDAGWGWNHEANVLVTDQPTAQRLNNYVRELLLGGFARKISEAWIKKYRRVWEARERLRAQDKALQRKRPKTSAGPSRLKGNTFAFTGAIKDYPRERKLYPLIRSLGGKVAKSAKGVISADCLVHAELGAHETTKKLLTAEEYGVPRITERDFFRLVKRENRLRKRTTTGIRKVAASI